MTVSAYSIGRDVWTAVVGGSLGSVTRVAFAEGAVCGGVTRLATAKAPICLDAALTFLGSQGCEPDVDVINVHGGRACWGLGWLELVFEKGV